MCECMCVCVRVCVCVLLSARCIVDLSPSLPPSLQLPLQAPPPCPGYVFARKSYGKVMRTMLTAVGQVAAGAASIEDQLKEVLGILEGVCVTCPLALVPS